MTINGKILAQGYIPSTLGTLYSVSGSRTYVKFFSLYNAGNVGIPTQSIMISVSSSMSTVIGRVELQLSESALVIGKDETLILGSGESIEGITNDNLAVQYTIIGGTE